MDIKLNSNRPLDAAENQPIRRTNTAEAANEAAHFEAAQQLERSLRDVPATRPEEVARAKELVNQVQYPPQEMMDRISSLLALHLK